MKLNDCMNQDLEKILTEWIQKVDKPLYVTSSELLFMIGVHWVNVGYNVIDLSPSRLGRMMKKLGFYSHSDGKKRGWLIADKERLSR